MCRPAAQAAAEKVVDIRTDVLSLVLSVAAEGTLLHHHFGGRIDCSAPFAEAESCRRAYHGTDNEAYPTLGGRNFREPALRVTTTTAT